MPEGDTIYKLGRRLRERLDGRTIVSVWLRERGEVTALRGSAVAEVATLGKHLLLVLRPQGAERPADDRVLHVHLGMRGRWREAAVDARVTPIAQLSLATSRDRFSCVRAAVVELLGRLELRDHRQLSRLGPDLMVRPFPLDAVVKRARARSAGSVAELLLDQTVACGLGNAFKSDVLFLQRLHPETDPARLDDAALRELFACAHRLMGWNRWTGRRVTTREVSASDPLARGEPTHWVYGRARQPCPRCGAPIAFGRVGDAARTTFWCADCQPGEG